MKEGNEKEIARHAWGLARKKATLGDIAQRLDITESAVCQWDVVPYDRVLVVEEVTGVSRHLLRPDVYPEPDEEGGDE